MLTKPTGPSFTKIAPNIVGWLSTKRWNLPQAPFIDLRAVRERFRLQYLASVKKLNLFDSLSVSQGFERTDTLLEADALRLERIVSNRCATRPGEWYDQEHSEWVVLLKGSAGLCVEGEKEILVLMPGDYVYLPAHLRHRVEWTSATEETFWLALHNRS